MLRCLLATAVLMGLVLAPPAGAATTIGPGVAAASGNVLGCNAGQTCVIAAETHPSVATTAPMSGVIVRWRIRRGANAGTLQLRILRPSTSGGHPTVVRSSDTIATSGGELVERTARLAIGAGERIGFEGRPTDPSKNFFLDINTDGSTLRSFSGGYPDGSTVPMLSSSNIGLKWDATIEPDADLDGWGDDTQDHCPSDASTHDSCPTAAPPDDAAPPASTPTVITPSVLPDTTAPVLANVVVAGRRLLYTLSERVTLQARLERATAGRRVGGRCVRITRRNRAARPCRRWVTVRALAAPGGAGAQSASLGAGRLARGTYRIVLVARDPVGFVATTTVAHRVR